MTSVADDVFLALGELGYTGSIQDRQYAFLQELTATIGLSSADMQQMLIISVGIPFDKVRDLLTLDEANYTSGPPDEDSHYPANDLYPSNSLYPSDGA